MNLFKTNKVHISINVNCSRDDITGKQTSSLVVKTFDWRYPLHSYFDELQENEILNVEASNDFKTGVPLDCMNYWTALNFEEPDLQWTLSFYPVFKI